MVSAGSVVLVLCIREVCHGAVGTVVEDDEVTIYRDAFGIPHVRAGSVTEVARDQGRACAQDRLWQIGFDRMRGEGRVAEWFGEAGLEWDAFARRAGLAEVARRAFGALDAETQAFVAAYVEGVNDVIDQGATAPELDELGVRLEPWPEWTPLAVFLAHHVLFGPFPGKLFRHRVRALLPEALPLFRTEGLSGGSNALVVGAARTGSGFPLVAGDPHRTFETPNVYAQVENQALGAVIVTDGSPLSTCRSAIVEIRFVPMLL
jgi:penicillin amidase